MTEPGSTTVFANESERVEAQRLVTFLEESLSSRPDAVDGAPDLTPAFARFLSTVLREVAEGHTVTVGTMPPELTTTVAAEQLGISRTSLMKLVRSGELRSHKVGTHTRVMTADVVALRKSRLRAQRRALDDLLALEDDLDIG
ncbi:helix-turn-helix domain-containing protein [Demequina soli]|uniref:helix-turn-helix domain-containing protein n=1 Tax=Demequina soli TaxID=1638987 RepID=UPI0009E3F2CA|nr:helix-turn-helix domain-containing protein [Demequina soli]